MLLRLISSSIHFPCAQTLTSPRGYFVICPRERAQEPKIARFRAWLLDQALRDRERLANLAPVAGGV